MNREQKAFLKREIFELNHYTSWRFPPKPVMPPRVVAAQARAIKAEAVVDAWRREADDRAAEIREDLRKRLNDIRRSFAFGDADATLAMVDEFKALVAKLKD